MAKIAVNKTKFAIIEIFDDYDVNLMDNQHYTWYVKKCLPQNKYTGNYDLPPFILSDNTHLIAGFSHAGVALAIVY